MYIATQKSRIGVLQKPCRVCGEGLGEGEPNVKAIQKEYHGGYTKEAEMGAKLIITVALFMIPVVGWAAALVLNVPVVGDAIWKFGMKHDPILKAFIGAFKKATHMEDCMKWWTDSNIRGMSAGIVPYPIDINAFIQKYSDAIHEYRLQRAQEIDIKGLVVSSLSGRSSKIGNIFVKLVQNSKEFMEFYCASMPQSRAKTGMTEADYTKANEYLGHLKEQAKQEEYTSTLQEIEQKIVSVLAPYIKIVTQKTGVIQQTRQAASVFQLPAGVLAIDRGALVLTPGTSSNLVIDYDAGKPQKQQVVAATVQSKVVNPVVGGQLFKRG